MYSLSCLRVTPGCTTTSRSALVHRQHLVHAADVERDAAVERADMALERGAGAEGDDRRLVAGAELDDLLHLLGRFGEHHGVGQVRLVEGDVLAVLLAHGVRRAHPVAIELPELGDGGVDLRGSGLRLYRGRYGHVGSPGPRRSCGASGTLHWSLAYATRSCLQRRVAGVGRLDTLKCRESQPRGNAPKDPQCATSTRRHRHGRGRGVGRDPAAGLMQSRRVETARIRTNMGIFAAAGRAALKSKASGENGE